jgi:hypothetical protein
LATISKIPETASLDSETPEIALISSKTSFQTLNHNSQKNKSKRHEEALGFPLQKALTGRHLSLEAQRYQL